MTKAAQTEIPADEATAQYAIVEIFGHRRHAGRIIEVEQFGTKMLRVDVPKDGDFDTGFTSHFYGGASIFSLTPCDLATALRINKPYEPAALLSYAEDDDAADLRDDEPAF